MEEEVPPPLTEDWEGKSPPSRPSLFIETQYSLSHSLITASHSGTENSAKIENLEEFAGSTGQGAPPNCDLSEGGGSEVPENFIGEGTGLSWGWLL